MIKKNYEFREVFSKGKYYSGNFIEIFILKNSEQSVNKLGIAISKKVGTSVIRHKIRRLIKENYRDLEDRILTGQRLIILWKKNVEKANATYYNIREDLIKIFQKVGVL